MFPDDGPTAPYGEQSILTTSRPRSGVGSDPPDATHREKPRSGGAICSTRISSDEVLPAVAPSADTAATAAGCGRTDVFSMRLPLDHVSRRNKPKRGMRFLFYLDPRHGPRHSECKHWTAIHWFCLHFR